MKNYKDRIKFDPQKTASHEAILVGRAYIKGRGVVLAAMDFNFLGGSMGMVVGEKFCRGVDAAIEQKLPFVVVSCSGGARMHEGLVSLAQMAKTSAALARLDEMGGLYISPDRSYHRPSRQLSPCSATSLSPNPRPDRLCRSSEIQETIKMNSLKASAVRISDGPRFVDMIVKRPDLRSEIAALIDYPGNNLGYSHLNLDYTLQV
jgi:acetyl-CoA carboxylase carboxyl transferase subunit beta